MATMPKEVRELFESVESCVLATASADAQPNACVIGMKSVIDDQTIYLSDQFFNKTLANLQDNTKVSIVFWQGHDAYQIHGNARYVTEGPEFEEQKAKVDAKFAAMGMPIKSKGGAFVDITAIYNTAAGPDAGKKIA